MSDLGMAIRRLLGDRNMSLHELSRRSYWSVAYLSRVINGQKRGSYALISDLDHVLDANGELLDVWTTAQGIPSAVRAVSELTDSARPPAGVVLPAIPDAAVRTLARWNQVHEAVGPDVLTGEQAGAGEIAHLEATAQLFRAWDHERGGGLGRKAVIGQLSEVAAILGRPHPVPLRRRLLGVASMLALTIASMSADNGDGGSAYRYLGVALDVAREARDAGLGARVANAIARRLLDDSRQGAALDLLDHARTSLRDLSGEMTAMLTTTEAWTHAMLGDYDHMASCLDRAARLSSLPGTVFGTAELAGIAGACFETLAARARPPKRLSYAERAEQHIANALRLRETVYARSRVLDLAGLANVRLCQDEPAEAVRVAEDAMEIAAALRSGRAVRRVHALAIRALQQYPQSVEVLDFADMVRLRLPVT
jgi:transcriptional regulator with XRE-family HTH domain